MNLNIGTPKLFGGISLILGYFQSVNALYNLSCKGLQYCYTNKNMEVLYGGQDDFKI